MAPFFKILLFVIAIVLTVVYSCAKADTVYLGQKSHHFKPVGKGITRESHSLLIYENEDGWMAGYWRNSFNKDTFAVGYHHRFWQSDEKLFSVGVKGGLATGYPLPVFGALNAQVWMVDINWVPTEVIAVGLKVDF